MRVIKIIKKRIKPYVILVQGKMCVCVCVWVCFAGVT